MFPVARQCRVSSRRARPPPPIRWIHHPSRVRRHQVGDRASVTRSLSNRHTDTPPTGSWTTTTTTTTSTTNNILHWNTHRFYLTVGRSPHRQILGSRHPSPHHTNTVHSHLHLRPRPPYPPLERRKPRLGVSHAYGHLHRTSRGFPVST